MNYHAAKHQEALSALKAKGFPIPPALDRLDDPAPLALSTRQDVLAYVEAHGGGADEIALMGIAVSCLAKTTHYLKATAREGAVRMTIAGEVVGPVSEEHRAAARLALDARAKRAAKPKPTAPKPIAARAARAAAAKGPPPPNPFRRGAPISAVEVERRRTALASLRKARADG